MSRSTGALLLAGVLLAQAPQAILTHAHAQAQSGGWFVPKSSQPAEPPAAHRRAAPQPTQAQQPVPDAMPQQGPDDSDQQQQAEQATQAQAVLPLPPIPVTSPLPKGAAPPAAVMGVISVPDVMRESSAGQQVEQVLGARRDKLNQDVAREQAGWRTTEKQIQDEVRGGLAQAQAQAKVRALQARAQTAQRDFRNRNRIIQEAAQVAVGQIERELVQVIKQVSAVHGMNLVLHREQVALNFPEFDITPQVINQLNSTLPSVFIPADGVDPEVLARSGTYPTTANPGPAPGTAPVVAPAATPVATPAQPAPK